MIKIGVALDPWKLKYFTDVLDKEEYKYETFIGKTMTTIKVEIEAEQMQELQAVIIRANNKARNHKKH